MLAQAEDLAREGGRTVLSAYTEHPLAGMREDGERVFAPEGRASLPASSPDVRFARAHGFRLGQIERSSTLALPLPAARARSLRDQVEARAGGYRTVSWSGRAPDRLLPGFAVLKERMVVDVPHAGIVLDDEAWTAARVRQHEDEYLDRGEPLLVTVAQDVQTDELVAYTELAVPGDGEKAEQLDTLVAGPHRGRRLGTLVKLVNLEQLAAAAPHIRRLITWNADENAAMLAVNDAFGFEPYALTGSWQKPLT